VSQENAPQQVRLDAPHIMYENIACELLRAAFNPFPAGRMLIETLLIFISVCAVLWRI